MYVLAHVCTCVCVCARMTRLEVNLGCPSSGSCPTLFVISFLFFVDLLILYVSVFGLHAYMYVCACTVPVPGFCGGQKRTWSPLELELQITVSCYVSLGTESGKHS